MTTSPVVTVTDELIAELERELAWSDKRSAEILAALLAERSELKKDAGRYRHIVKWLSHYGAGVARGVCMPNDYSSSTKEQCDTSIDAAMQAAK